MQNIADNFINTYVSRRYKGIEGMALFIFSFKVCHLLPHSSVCVLHAHGTLFATVLADMLDTFIVYNERRRVTSSAKKKRKHADKSLHQVSLSDYLCCL